MIAASHKEARRRVGGGYHLLADEEVMTLLSDVAARSEVSVVVVALTLPALRRPMPPEGLRID